MKNRHRVCQVVSKLVCSRAARRKILRQGAADRSEHRQAAGAVAILNRTESKEKAAIWRPFKLGSSRRNKEKCNNNGSGVMSALPPKADIVRHGGNVRFVPKADSTIVAAQRPPASGLVRRQAFAPG
jgi:hypothetical protein